MYARRDRLTHSGRWAAVSALLVVVALTGCADGAPDDGLQASDQLISVSPTTVAPTPANASPEEGSLASWCRELESASEDRVEEIYRKGTELDNQIVARAAALLLSGEGDEQELVEAGDRIERACDDGA